MKRIWINILLAVVLSVFLFAIGGTVLAAAPISGTCGTNATWSLDGNGKLIVSGTGAMDDYEKRENTPWSESINKIKTVTFSNGITKIGSHAFEDCSQLTVISLPGNLKTIERDAFHNCSALRNLTLPDGLETIGVQAFAGCDSINTVTIPRSVVSIQPAAFIGCDKLKTLSVQAGSSAYASVDGAIYTKDMRMLVCVPGAYAGIFTVPDTVEIIEMASFFECRNLSGVVLPENLREIRPDTFVECSGLSSITLPEGVDSIGEYAFTNCTGLKDIYLPSGVKFVGQYSFYQCSLLKDVYYGGSKIDWNRIDIQNGNEPLRDAALHPDYTPMLFTDVHQQDYFYDPVLWAVNEGITNGTSKTAFSPFNTCTREQIITFLWRANKKPSVNIRNPFTDVSSSDYFYMAALWAYQKGLVKGSTFEGKRFCTRGEVMTYFWRIAGSPSIIIGNSFQDVASTADYAQAVYWASEQGITQGTSTTTFSPNLTCTRAQIVTFLYRKMVATV